MKISSQLVIDANVNHLANRETEIVEGAHKRLLAFIASNSPAAHTPGSAIPEKLGVKIPRASAYLPCLLAEPFGLTKPLVVEEAAFANLCLDLFSRAVDFSTDNAKMSDPTLIHLGSLCMGKAAQIYGNLLPRGDAFWKYWEQYLKEASESERFLWRHRASVVPFGKLDFTALGRKSALIKTTAAFYASLTNRWGNLDEVENGLDATATGVQIMDDLLDWEEDLEAGIYTFPLVLAKENLSPTQSVEHAINSPNVVIPVLCAAIESLTLGRRHFENVHAKSLVAFINALLGNIQDAKTYVEHLPAPKVAHHPVLVVRHLRRMITPRLAH